MRLHLSQQQQRPLQMEPDATTSAVQALWGRRRRWRVGECDMMQLLQLFFLVLIPHLIASVDVASGCRGSLAVEAPLGPINNDPASPIGHRPACILFFRAEEAVS